MVWALILGAFLAFSTPAYASEMDSPSPVASDSAEAVDDFPVEDASQNSPYVVLTADDLNSLVDSRGDSEGVEDSVRVSIDPDTLEIVSLDNVGLDALSESSRTVSGSPYSSVTSGTYTELASACIPHLAWDDNYVFFRSGQYEYKLVFGNDLTFSNGVFSGSDCTVITWSQTTAQYQNYYEQRVTNDSINLSVGNYIVWSNLGDFPCLNSEYFSSQYIVFVAWVAVIMSLIRPIFAWTLRTGVAVYETHQH